jgi:hypothetical protein
VIGSAMNSMIAPRIAQDLLRFGHEVLRCNQDCIKCQRCRPSDFDSAHAPDIAGMHADPEPCQCKAIGYLTLVNDVVLPALLELDQFMALDRLVIECDGPRFGAERGRRVWDGVKR